MIALSHVEAVGRLMAGREYARGPAVKAPSLRKLTEAEAVAMAVERIRTLRGSPERCGFPDDLGCYTQLYLGLAAQKAFPRRGNVWIADLCKVGVTDAHFFAQLLELARNGDWVVPEIVDAAARIFGRC